MSKEVKLANLYVRLEHLSTHPVENKNLIHKVKRQIRKLEREA